MAYVAVESLLEKLRQLLIYHKHLIGSVEDDLGELDRVLRSLKPFLAEERRKDDGVRKQLRAIRGDIYQAEDIIDDFLLLESEWKQEAERKQGTALLFRRSSKSKPDPPNISNDLKSVIQRLSKINESTKIRNESPMPATAGDGCSLGTQAFSIRDDKLLGFEEKTETLIGYLTEETEQLDVVSIVGVPGLGKTTLARKIFCDKRIRANFPTLVWVNISQEFTMKDVFLAILSELMFTDDVFGRTSGELAHVVATNLKKVKFLIVMDNLRSVEDWAEIETALPKGNNRGKVLITSSDEEVCQHVSRGRPPHKLRLLNEEDSWLFLESEVFRGPKCPPELESLGKLVAGQCGGLPLALIVMGGVLKRGYSPSSLDKTKSEWTKAYQSIHSYIYRMFYEDFPDPLRDCFLYLGMFPEGYEIPVSKLISLWIAEGFIPQKEGSTLEATAEKYLVELITANLIKIEKFKSDGCKARTCRIDHKLREFCKTEAGHENENLFQEIRKSNVGVFEPQVSKLNEFRRLCIHSYVSDFFSSTPAPSSPAHSAPSPSAPERARTFLCFSEDVVPSSETSSAILAFSRLLKVVDVKPIKFTEIPKGVHKLMHLKYIALSITDLSVLPAAFSELWNIETLIVDTTHPTLEIKADISKMMQLRRLKTNASASLPKPSKSDESKGEELHTLGAISLQSCTKEVFDNAPNLKKLGIRRPLPIVRHTSLNKLKLTKSASSSSEGRLPPSSDFPPRLEYLTLSDTRLNWKHMSILASLERLKVLKLKDDAFVGETWHVDDEIFLNLEVLRIGRADLVSWKASDRHFPKLRCLLLKDCAKLEEVPIGLADVPSLQLLDLKNCSTHAVPSAKNIEEAILKNQEQKNIKHSPFKLNIY